MITHYSIIISSGLLQFSLQESMYIYYVFFLANSMSFQNLRKKIEHYPEVLGIILFFALMMTQPVSEQYLYKVYSEKYGIPYKFDSSKTGCPIGNDTNSNKTLLTQQVCVVFL